MEENAGLRWPLRIPFSATDRQEDLASRIGFCSEAGFWTLVTRKLVRA